MKKGRGETMTHDYKRNGTVDLFAALNVGAGEVLYETRKRYTAKDVLAFFKLIDLYVPRDVEVHVVLDKPLGTQGPRGPRLVGAPQAGALAPALHPTSSSWLNLTQRRLRRGTFNSVAVLVEAIETWAEHYNDNPTQFTWTQDHRRDHHQSPPGRATLTEAKSATHF